MSIGAALVLVASSGCWIVAGLEDRTLLGPDSTDGATLDGPGGDGAQDGAVEGAADGGSTRCHVDDPFPEGGTLVMGLGSPEREYSATLTEDELEIIVSSDWNYPKSAPASPFTSVFHARRPDRASAFTDISKIPFDDNTGWASPTLADDAGLLYLVGYPDGGYPGTTFFTGRVDAGQFSTELGQVVGELSGHDFIHLDSTGNTLFYAERRSGTGPLILKKKDGLLGNDAGFGSASVELTTINEYANDGGFDIAAPVLSRGREVIYFVISPIDNSRNWIYRAARLETSSRGDFDPATIAPVSEVNVSSPRNFPVWVSPDLCRLYVSQFRGTGTRDLYVYEKKPR